MKKTTKTTSSRAPATSPDSALKKASKAAGAPRVLPPAEVAKARPATPPPSSPATTVITAKIDVGFGNSLYLRGEGPGLSWSKGRPLDCVGSAQWTVSLAGAGRPFTFKFLLNDKTWNIGENYVAAPGSRLVYTPTF